MEKTMNKKESIERMLVLANRLNTIVAELNAKKEAILQSSYKKAAWFAASNKKPRAISVFLFLKINKIHLFRSISFY